jgi:hypothetical protein
MSCGFRKPDDDAGTAGRNTVFPAHFYSGGGNFLECVIGGLYQRGSICYFFHGAIDQCRGVFGGIGRARWKIENETFNTLKNQGYQIEQSYGHGKQYLSIIYSIRPW